MSSLSEASVVNLSSSTSSLDLDNKRISTNNSVDDCVDSMEISDESINRAPVASTNPDDINDLKCDDESVIGNKKKHNLIDSDLDEPEKQSSVKMSSSSVASSLDNKLTNINNSDSIENSDESIILAPVALNQDEINDLNCDESDDESVFGNRKKHNLINSDSDESEKENVAPETPEKQTPEKQTPEKQSPGKKKKSRLRQISDDSDSENETSPLKENNDIFVTDPIKQDQKSRLNELVDSDSDDESQLEQDEQQQQQIQNLKNICDSESEDETPRNTNQPLKPSKTKSKPEKKMTGRDAKEQMHQIKSESQKMMRESRVSLPYHRPKQHTLQEFLDRRRKSLVPSVETSFSIKMSSQDLVKAAERLKEREKEIEKFYNDEEDDEESTETEEKTDEKTTEETEITKDDFGEKTTEETEKTTEDFGEKTTEDFGEKTKEDFGEKTTEETEKTKEDFGEKTQKPDVLVEETLENLLDDLEKAVEDETPQIEELRNVLIELSSRNMEQLPEELETSSEKLPETCSENQTEIPSKATEDETPEKFLEKKLSNLTPIIALKKDFKPRLSGSGGDVIVLNEDVDRSKGVSDLMKRFLLHTNKNKPTPQKDEEPEDELKMEHEPDEAAKKNLTPGLKFKKLKASLEEQIVLKRLEEWKKRQEEEIVTIEEKVIGDEEEEEEYEEDISEEESSEDSEEEEDVVLEDAPTKRSAFVDDEAEDDSPDEDDSSGEDDSLDEDETEEKQPHKRIIIQEDSDSDEPEEITTYQPLQSEKTPSKQIQENKDLSTFLTPTLHLTALQGMTSTTKSLQDSPGLVLSPDPSPLRPPATFKTKLFAETEDINMEDLENLCSGKFTGPTQPQEIRSEGPEIEENQSEGPEIEENLSEEPEYQIEFDDASLDLKNEPEIPLQFQKFNAHKFVICSDSEDELVQEVGKKKKKYIIDDISISDDDDEPQDFIDDEVDDDLEEDEVVDYDSEENEVQFDSNPTTKLRDYFEAEAELSGSDWDSADEDEKGLDDFEAEAGDEDKISEKKLQRELGRIHAHTVMEEDKQDVRLLQELLLEDGELHGAGREKKFKWKNADSTTWGDAPPPEEDEEIEEAENEAEWRKMRHEREMFLKEQPKPAEDNEDDSLIVLDKTHQKTPIAESLSNNPDIKLPFTLTHKRGSFLMRSETTLARLAQLTRSTPANLQSGPKNSRNFVFTTIEKSDTTIVVEDINEKKRKAIPETPKILKKMRVAESPQQTKKLI